MVSTRKRNLLWLSAVPVVALAALARTTAFGRTPAAAPAQIPPPTPAVIFQGTGADMRAIAVACAAVQKSGPRYGDVNLYVVQVTADARTYTVALTPRPGLPQRVVPPGTPMLVEIPSWRYIIRKSDFQIESATGVL